MGLILQLFPHVMTTLHRYHFVLLGGERHWDIMKCFVITGTDNTTDLTRA